MFLSVRGDSLIVIYIHCIKADVNVKMPHVINPTPIPLEIPG